MMLDNIRILEENIQARGMDGRLALASYLKALRSHARPVRVLWYPSAGNDFRDLINLSPEHAVTLGVESVPSVFIHTDYRFELPADGVLHRSSQLKVKVLDASPLEFPGVDFEIDLRFVSSPGCYEPRGTVYLLHLWVASRNAAPFTADVLYAVYENANFFRELILKRGLQISHLVNIRDGAGCGGGGHVNCKFLMCFLGLMGTEYYVTDSLGRASVGGDLVAKMLMADPGARHAMAAMKPVMLTALKQMRWSGYGIFRGDAFVMKVEPLAAALSA